MQPGFQGILYKGGDESYYITRIEQAMYHPFTDVSNGIVSGPAAPRGLQSPVLEMLMGSIFSWTGLTAPVLAFIISVVLAPLCIPLFAMLSLRVGAKETAAMTGAVLYFFLLIGPLRRIVHQSWSLPFVLFTCIMLVDCVRKPTLLRSMLLGACLGFASGVYLWAWTYLWASFGCMVAFVCITEWKAGSRENAMRLFRHATGVGVIALVVSSPILFIMWQNMHHPAIADAGIRSLLVHAREFESVPRSMLFLLFTGMTTWVILRRSDRQNLIPLLALLIAMAAVLHQQFVHGIVLSYWTHYYQYVCMVALLVILTLLTLRDRSVLALSSMVVASIFLVAAFTDYYGRIAVLDPIPQWDMFQHLSQPVRSLNRIEKQTVLSDTDSSFIVAMYTDHDVVFTPFMRHTLVSFTELAERYCLTQLVRGSPPDTTWLGHNVEEQSRTGRVKAREILARDLVLTAEACERVTNDPRSILQKYGVTMVLWDEKNHPEWNISEKYFSESEKGLGWSLWTLR